MWAEEESRDYRDGVFDCLTGDLFGRLYDGGEMKAREYATQ